MIFNHGIDEKWDDLLPECSENSLLKDALEELESSAQFLFNVQPSPTPSSLSTPSTPDNFLADFINIDDFLGTDGVFEPSPEPFTMVDFKNEQVLPTEHDKCNDVNLIDGNRFLESCLTDNAVLDTLDIFPNMVEGIGDIADIGDIAQIETVDTSELHISKNKDLLSKPPQSAGAATSNCLEAIMLQSGIKLELNDVPLSGIKRKNSTEIQSCATKSPKMIENDNDDDCSVYSSSVSSPENKVVKRRIKNNMASKVSRANRKAKHSYLFDKEQQLQVDNTRLRTEIEIMAKEAEALRKILIDKLSGTP